MRGAVNMQKISPGWMLAGTLLLAALLTSCMAPSREPAAGARAEAATSTAVTEAPATATAATTMVASSNPEPAPSAVTLAVASATARVSSSTATRTHTPTTQPTKQPAPSPTPARTATASAIAPATTAVTATATASPTAAPVTAVEDLATIGLQLYKEQYCGVCHQLGTANTAGLFGPVHDGMGATAQQRILDPSYTGGATSPEGYVLESIVHPQVFVVPGYENSNHQMPAYTALSDEQVMALVQMLLSEE